MIELFLFLYSLLIFLLIALAYAITLEMRIQTDRIIEAIKESKHEE